MKALGAAVPSGTWFCEIKFDGYRALSVLNREQVEIWSRNHKPLTADYPEIAEALRSLDLENTILDGEIVALDGAGKSRFQLLQGRDLSGQRPPIVYFLFDVLAHRGESLANSTIEKRREALQKLSKNLPPCLRISPAFEIEPAVMLAEVRKQGLEGIIAKRPGSFYEAGRRSGAWVKCKIVSEQEFVIGGFTPPRNSRPYFGAILVGYYEGSKLMYAGKVGTGFDHNLLKSLHGLFLKIQREDCPFKNLPLERRSRFGQGMTRREMASVTWLEPKLVAQIKFGEWTDDGMLRQPVFLGLRKDKPAHQVRREPNLQH
ncbi:MAG: non-homologous end-joining DNA ligase [Nibricoccus sp.]